MHRVLALGWRRGLDALLRHPFLLIGHARCDCVDSDPLGAVWVGGIVGTVATHPICGEPHHLSLRVLDEQVQLVNAAKVKAHHVEVV